MEKKYTALDLIEDLKVELQQFSNELALLFPKRTRKFGNRNLSILWGKSQNYVSKIISKIKNNNRYRILDDEEGLKKLERIINKYGLRGKKSISLIVDYRNNNLSTIEFITLIEKELGKISGYIPVTDYELGLILMGQEKYFERLKARINNENDSDYNPNFKFSRERLIIFKDALESLLGDRAQKCISYIIKYEQLNPNLKDFSNQQYSLKNHHIFTNFDTLDTFYWLGYLYADGYVNKRDYRINFELSSKDAERVEEFAKFIGLDFKYVHNRKRIVYTNDVQKFFNFSYVHPVCKPMTTDLCNLGYCETKAARKNLPKFICELIDIAKIKDRENWFFASEGKKATTWLFGFYDGDGSYLDFHTARLRAASETLLRQIKDYFDIPNKVIVSIKPDEEIFIYGQIFFSVGYYQLNLGGQLFKAMLQNYKNTLKRKRPPNE